MQEIPLVVIFQVPLGGFYKKRKKLSTVQTDLMEHTKMIAPPPPPTLNLAAFMYVPLGLVCEFFVTLTHEPFSIVLRKIDWQNKYYETFFSTIAFIPYKLECNQGFVI